MNNYYQQQQYAMAAPSAEIRQQVLKNTYLLLALSMIPTAIGALIGVNMSFAFLLGSPIMGTLLLIGGMYFLMFMVQKNRNSFAGIVWLMAFTLLMGLLLGPLFQVALRIPNGSQLILLAAVLTSAVFFVMSAIAFTIKRETPFLTNFLAIGGIVILISMIAMIFFHTPMMQLILCGAFVIFSSLMILWQVNQIIIGGETNYISATLSIYVSLYNLFTSLLQIIIALSGNDRR
ncbi:MAG TPA: Bax inhibitor-1 family protein [Burkholderiales bacterium]|jgi:modulator of FtsH protease|nr:Bax inhibitor-1 family protein [Burkholderiales bacterium]